MTASIQIFKGLFLNIGTISHRVSRLLTHLFIFVFGSYSFAVYNYETTAAKKDTTYLWKIF